MREVCRRLHYLYDFLLLGPPGHLQCEQFLALTLALCEELGFPLASEKTEGPATTHTFLGIEIDTVWSQTRLLQDKLDRLKSTIALWMRQTNQLTAWGSGKKRELLSLIGLFTHAALVVRPGKAFLRSLIDVAAAVLGPPQQCCTCRPGLVAHISRVLEWQELHPSFSRPLFITSDASGFWGCGAAYENLWFQLQWSESWENLPIAPKELVPIVIAVILWGPYWVGRHICCLCDNTAVVAVVNKRVARDSTLSHLLRLLAFALAVLDILLTARHLPGTQNT